MTQTENGAGTGPRSGDGAAGGSGSGITREQIVGDLAEMLDVAPSDLTDEVNVLDLGLDSVRMMSLVERWRAAGATHVDLVTLAEDPVVGAWVRELTGS